MGEIFMSARRERQRDPIISTSYFERHSNQEGLVKKVRVADIEFFLKLQRDSPLPPDDEGRLRTSRSLHCVQPRFSYWLRPWYVPKQA